MLYEVITHFSAQTSMGAISIIMFLEAAPSRARNVIWRKATILSRPTLTMKSRHPRITSYNVCYTKLLRWACPRRRYPGVHCLRVYGIRKHEDNNISPYWQTYPDTDGDQSRHEKILSVVCPADSHRVRPRITSYNVCYTKLLRWFSDKMKRGYAFLNKGIAYQYMRNYSLSRDTFLVIVWIGRNNFV